VQIAGNVAFRVNRGQMQVTVVTEATAFQLATSHYSLLFRMVSLAFAVIWFRTSHNSL
jgi:hypothetical protein